MNSSLTLEEPYIFIGSLYHYYIINIVVLLQPHPHPGHSQSMLGSHVHSDVKICNSQMSIKTSMNIEATLPVNMPHFRDQGPNQEESVLCVCSLLAHCSSECLSITCFTNPNVVSLSLIHYFIGQKEPRYGTHGPWLSVHIIIAK